MNLYQHVKNQFNPFIHSSSIANFCVLPPATRMHFIGQPYHKNNSFNGQIFLWKTLFWPIFDHFPQFFGQKKFFQKNLALSHTSYWFLATYQNCEKSNDPVSRKHPDAGQKYGQILLLYHRTFQATARGPTSITVVDWYLKVKDIENVVSLTKKMAVSQSACKKSAQFVNSFLRYSRF